MASFTFRPRDERVWAVSSDSSTLSTTFFALSTGLCSCGLFEGVSVDEKGHTIPNPSGR
jgi:hypothetical protein